MFKGTLPSSCRRLLPRWDSLLEDDRPEALLETLLETLLELIDPLGTAPVVLLVLGALSPRLVPKPEGRRI
jgi:hypothetical protein